MTPDEMREATGADKLRALADEQADIGIHAASADDPLGATTACINAAIFTAAAELAERQDRIIALLERLVGEGTDG